MSPLRSRILWTLIFALCTGAVWSCSNSIELNGPIAPPTNDDPAEDPPANNDPIEDPPLNNDLIDDSPVNNGFEEDPPECVNDTDCEPFFIGQDSPQCSAAICQEGQCVLTPANVDEPCGPENFCATMTCDAQGRCIAVATNDDVCDNNSFCDGTELCQPNNEQADARGCIKVPLNLDDGDPCTRDVCNEEDDTIDRTLIPCDCERDEQCLSETCQAGRCRGGSCVLEPEREGTPCDDGIACTEGDACTADQACLGTPVDRQCIGQVPICANAGLCQPNNGMADTRGCTQNLSAMQCSPNDGLVLWLDAHTGVQSDNNGVQRWQDLSAANTSVVQNAPNDRPEHIDNGINLPVVRVRGDWMELSNIIPRSFTIAVVFRSDFEDEGRDWWDCPALLSAEVHNDANDMALVLCDGRVGWGEATVGYQAQTPEAQDLTDGQFHVVILTRQQAQGTVKLTVDQQETIDGLTIAEPLDSSEVLWIGRHPTDRAPWDVDIAEILIYDRALGGPRTEEVRQYLLRKWVQ